MDRPPISLVGPGGGEVVGDAPDRRVEILCDVDALHATWSRFAPGRDGADLHVHRQHTDHFYVLEGELTVRLGVDGDEVAAPTGTLARVPPMVVHGFRNAGDAEVRFLNLHAPGRGFAAFMRGLRDGRPVPYDQWDPPDAGELRPASEASLTAGDGVLADAPELRVAVVAPEQVGADTTAAYVLHGQVALPDGRPAPAGSWIGSPGGGLRAGDGPPARVLELRAS